MSSLRQHQSCRAVPCKGIYSPMPRRVSRNFSTSTGEQNPSGTLWEALPDSLQSTAVWKLYCSWSRQPLRLKPGLSPNCLEGCGSATLRAGWPYDARMMYNSIYLVAWTSDVSLAVKRDDFPLNSSYWQVPVLVFALLWYRAHVTQPRVVWRGCAHSVTEWWLATSQQHKSECTIKAQHVVSKQGTIVSFCHLAVG